MTITSSQLRLWLRLHLLVTCHLNEHEFRQTTNIKYGNAMFEVALFKGNIPIESHIQRTPGTLLP